MPACWNSWTRPLVMEPNANSWDDTAHSLRCQAIDLLNAPICTSITSWVTHATPQLESRTRTLVCRTEMGEEEKLKQTATSELWHSKPDNRVLWQVSWHSQSREVTEQVCLTWNVTKLTNVWMFSSEVLVPHCGRISSKCQNGGQSPKRFGICLPLPMLTHSLR